MARDSRPTPSQAHPRQTWVTGLEGIPWPGSRTGPQGVLTNSTETQASWPSALPDARPQKTPVAPGKEPLEMRVVLPLTARASLAPRAVRSQVAERLLKRRLPHTEVISSLGETLSRSLSLCGPGGSSLLSLSPSVRSVSPFPVSRAD